jgi:uncharacterized protein (TIGR03067 family)
MSDTELTYATLRNEITRRVAHSYKILPCLPIFILAMLAAGCNSNGKETERLQGHWEVVAFEENGVKKPLDRRIVLQVNGTRLEGPPLFGEFFVRALQVNVSTHPKQIDVLEPRGVAWEWPQTHGVYLLEGNALTVCSSGIPGLERPREFATWPGSGLVLITLTRVGD